MNASPIHVLLIEDNPGDARLIEECLADSGNTRIKLRWVNRLETGLAYLARGGHDVVLLDLGLPDSKGLDTMRRVQAHAPTVPIVVLTGLADEPVALQAMHEGAEDYLVKGKEQSSLLGRSLRYAIERKRVVESLRESEQRYKRLLDSVTDYIYTVQVENGRALATTHSPGSAAVTGYPPAAFAADPQLWICMVPEEDRPAVLGQVAAMLARAEAQPLEHRIRHADGSIRWIRNTPVPHVDERGRLTCYDGLVSDITARRQAEEALRDSEAIYQSLVDNIPFQLIRKDRSGRFMFANRQFCDQLGMPLAQIRGKTDFDLYPEDLAAKYRRDDERVLATGEVYTDTEQHPQAMGERRYVKVIKTPVRDAQNAILGLQVLFWDVTVLRRAEDQEGQMRAARAIQQRLFPLAAPRVTGFDIGGASHPAEATGGDYFDYIAMPNSTLGIVLGDVSGHGFGPALLAAVVHSCLRTLALMQMDVSIETLLATGNRLLYEDTGGEQFVTLLFARLDPRTRSLEYCSAGHPTGFILSPSGSVRERLASNGPVLGIFADERFPCSPALRLERGEIVLFLSDGVLEAMAPDGAPFGVVRALEVVRRHRQQSAQAIVDALCQAARDHYGNTPQNDDITAVVIKVQLATASTP